MKKILMVGLLAAAALVCASSAFAVPVTFVDVVSVNQWLGSASFTHSIIDNGFVTATDTLSDATLDLDMVGVVAKVNLNLESYNQGNFWVNDPALDDYAVNVTWLQSDGQLNVTVSKNWGLPVYLCSSSLTVNGDRAAVPEPATMALLGTGLIGLIGLKRRK